MIGLSTQLSNLYGAVILNELALSEAEKRTARISRSSTLDGGVILTHYGVSDGDRVLNVSAILNETESNKLRDIFLNNTYVNIAMSDGFFYGMIKDFQNNNGNIAITLYIKDTL